MIFGLTMFWLEDDDDITTDNDIPYRSYGDRFFFSYFENDSQVKLNPNLYDFLIYRFIEGGALSTPPSENCTFSRTKNLHQVNNYLLFVLGRIRRVKCFLLYSVRKARCKADFTAKGKVHALQRKISDLILVLDYIIRYAAWIFIFCHSWPTIWLHSYSSQLDSSIVTVGSRIIF